MVPNRDDILNHVAVQWRLISQKVSGMFEISRERLNNILSSYGMRKIFDFFKQYSQTLDDISHQLEVSCNHKISLLKERIERFTEHLKSLDPSAVLKRGYSICQRQSDLKIILKAKDLKKTDTVHITFSEGKAEGYIEKVI